MSIRISMLAYDIPTDCPLPNPSAQLRRIGFRINLSAWAIPTHLIPYNLINEYSEAGATFTPHVEFATDQAEKLAAMAVAALRREVEEAERAALDGQDAAVKAAETDESGKGMRRFKTRAACNLSRCRRLLRDAEDAAENLGIDKALIGREGAWNTIEALRVSAAAQAKVYAEMTRRLRELGDDGAATAEANQLPGFVAADRLEELGETALAQDMRDMFPV